MPVPTHAIQPKAGELAGLSPFHLSAEQIRFFDENGYLVLRNWITGPILKRLQDAATAWIDMGKDLPEVPMEDKSNQDFSFADRPSGRVMYRVNYIHDKGQDASLELLGDPRMLAVAESLCGRNFVPTYESMVFKQAGDGEKVKWHQDAIHPHRKWRIFNFDLYLDPSQKDAGALRVLPGRHYDQADICSLVGSEEWEGEQIQVVEMEPGDVLLHDVMVVHGSPRTLGNKLRRTLYYEFRAAEEILEDGPWDRDWISRRMRLIPLSQRRHAAANPSASPFPWQPSPEFRPAPLGDDATELKIAHVVHNNWTYCSAGDAVKP